MTNVRKLSIRERFGHLAKKPDRDEAERQRRAAEFEEAKRFLTTPTADAHTEQTAAAIVAAGKKRRGEVSEFEPGPPPFEPVKMTAADIIAAVKKRDSGDDLLPPMTADVQAIINAGKKRRGENET